MMHSKIGPGRYCFESLTSIFLAPNLFSLSEGILKPGTKASVITQFGLDLQNIEKRFTGSICRREAKKSTSGFTRPTTRKFGSIFAEDRRITWKFAGKLVINGIRCVVFFKNLSQTSLSPMPTKVCMRRGTAFVRSMDERSISILKLYELVLSIEKFC